MFLLPWSSVHVVGLKENDLIKEIQLRPSAGSSATMVQHWDKGVGDEQSE